MSTIRHPPAERGQPRVRDLMRRDFIRMTPDEELWDAIRLMGMARVRDLPVVGDGGALRGMVSHRDLARAALDQARSGGRAAVTGNIAPWVRDGAPAVDPDAPLSAAAGAMLRSGMACLAAVDAGRLVGLVTEGDLLRAAFERPLF